MASARKHQVVNEVVVFDPSSGVNALDGLQIMDCTTYDQSELTRSPIETGVQIADCKVRMPRRVVIKGMCDNKRGPLLPAKDTRSSIDTHIPNAIGGGAINSMVNGVMNTLIGYEFETAQMIMTRARSVYKKIHLMYTDRTRVDGKPKTWIISTKGAVYKNMILKSVEQLNDWEHLMLVPVTLTFEELMMVGEDEEDSVSLSEDDSIIQTGGSMKKGNLAEEMWNGIKGAM